MITMISRRAIPAFASLALVSLSVIAVAAPPECPPVMASPAELSPPNHRMEAVTLSSSQASRLAPYCVMQDEEIDSTGDGSMAPDAILGRALSLRAERAGNGDGRYYHVYFSGEQGGRQCLGHVAVTVAKSASKPAVDGGPRVNAAGGGNCRNESPNSAPILDTTSLQSAYARDAWVQNLQAHDYESDSFTMTLVDGPAGLTLDGQVLRWTPAVADVGDHAIVIELADARGARATYTLNLVVLPPLNQPPEARDAALTTAEDTALQATLVATDPDGDSLDYVITRPPLHGVLTGIAPNLVYVPDADFHGTDSFAFRAADLYESSAEAQVTLQVTPVNDAPVFTSVPVVDATEAQPWHYAMAATDVDGDALAYSLESGPAAMTLAGSLLSWEPDYASAGAHPTTVRVLDTAGASARQDFTITVSNTNRPPQAMGGDVVTDEDVAVAAYLAGMDIDGDSLDYSVVVPPLHGTLTGIAPDLVYTPDPDYAGVDELTFRVTDIYGATSEAVIRITVNAINDLPVFQPAPPLALEEGQPWSYLLSATDVDGDAIGFTLLAAPAGMTLIDDATLDWTPDFNQSGSHVVTVRATDANGAYVDVTFTLAVANTNRAPRIVSSPELFVTAGQAWQYVVEAVDDDGDFIGYTLKAAPAGIAFDALTGTLSWAPTRMDAGSWLIEIEAADIHGAVDTQLFTLTVELPPNHAPRFTVTEIPDRVTEGTLYAVLATAEDPDGDALSYSLVPVDDILQAGVPEGADIGLMSGLLTWTPGALQVGEHRFLVRVTDIYGASADLPVSVTVRANLDPFWISQPVRTWNAPENYRYVLEAIDPEGQAISYQLVSGPSGMTVAGNELAWNPGYTNNGSQTITLAASDEYGRQATQTFALLVDVRHPPMFTTTPPQVIFESESVDYLPQAVDPNGGAVDITATALAAGGDFSGGRLQWSPAADYVMPLTTRTPQCRRPSTTLNFSAIKPSLRYKTSVGLTLNTPLVAQLTDDNGDGRIDDEDFPEIIVGTGYAAPGYSVTTSGRVQIIDGVTGEMRRTIEHPDHQFLAWPHMAIADLDDDGVPEILVAVGTGGVAAVTPDGNIKWEANPTTLGANYFVGVGEVMIHVQDMDGDGSKEILAGRVILNHDGSKRKVLSAPGSAGKIEEASLSYFSDLDGDGLPEVVIGPRVYRNDGTLWWSKSSPVSAYSAAADVDGDGKKELFFVHGGGFMLTDHLGNLRWSQKRAMVNVGMPSAGDVNGDGVPEFLYASWEIRDGYALHAIDANGHTMWRVGYSDDSESGHSGVALFDFNGDGAMEVVHSDEGTIRIIDGASGRVVWTMSHGNRTRHEYAAFADLEGDGSAEMIVGGDQVQVFGAAANNWMPAPRTWPQYTTTDWSDFVPNMPTPKNAFRAAGFSDSSTYLPNIGLRAAQWVAPDSLRVTVINRGDIDVDARYRVQASDASGLLGESNWPLELAAGNDASLNVALSRVPAGDVDVSIEVLDGAADCLDADNVTRLPQFALLATSAEAETAEQRFFVNVLPEQAMPEVAATLDGGNASIGTLYRYRVVATDSDRGELLRYALVSPLAGMRINHTNGEISWNPSRDVAGQVVPVAVTVTDTAGNVATTTVSINVLDTPEAPVFVSLPRSDYIPDRDYERSITAVDYNIGDRVSYTLERGPKGMKLNSDTGAIFWSLADLYGYRQSQEHVDPRCTGIDVVPTQIKLYEHVTTTAEGWYLEYGFRQRGTGTSSFQYGYVLTYMQAGGSLGQSGLAFTTNPYSTGRFIAAPFTDLADDISYRAYRYNGTECQTTNNTIKVPLVVIRATDLTGRYTRTAFTLNVEDTDNHAPEILSNPGPDAAVGATWQYALTAKDAEPGETLYYSVQSPTLAITRSGNLFSITPTLAQVGLHQVTFTVTDSAGATATQTLELRIHDPAVTSNRPPVVTSTPVLTAVLGQLYTYTLTASDPDGDPVTVSWSPASGGDSFRVTPGTAGATFTWYPEVVKSFYFDAAVRDSSGFETRQTFYVNVSKPASGVPVISSTPTRYVTAGNAWGYQLLASDPEGSVLDYLLYAGPSGMGSNGNLFNWLTDAADVGLHTVEVRAVDPQGYQAAQRFTVQVNPVQNRPPVITSAPGTSRSFDSEAAITDYTYVPAGFDADGDAISWRVVSGPTGFAWVPLFKRFELDSTRQDIGGVYPITIAASDGKGETLQSWVLYVTERQNLAPFVSSPTVTIPASVLYTYTMTPSDPNGDAVTLSLVSAPAGMQLVGKQLRWTPLPSQIGTHQYRVKAVDTAGAAYNAEFTIKVTAGTTNYPPYFTTQPPGNSVEAGRTYRYTVAAKDPNGTALTYSMASGPAGAQFDPATRTLSWPTVRSDIGGAEIVLRVSDGTYAVDQIVGVTVYEPNAPGLELGVLPDVVNATEPVTLWVDGYGGYGALTTQLWINDVEQVLTNNALTFRPPTAGEYRVRARVTDAEGTFAEQTHLVVAGVDGDTTPPVITLHNLNDNDTLTAPLALRATIDDPNLRSYIVRFRPLGGEWQDLAVGHVAGSGPVENAVIADLDPSLLLNGFHELKVAALDLNDNYREINLSLLVEGDLKVGNFGFSVEDVNVPVSGLPVRVTRSYDTRARLKQGDFSYGWSLTVADARVEENRDPGANWKFSSQYGLFPTYCIDPVGKRRVSITLPDGAVEKFTLTMKPACRILLYPAEMEPQYTPEAGTTSKLEAVKADGSTYTHLNLNGGRLIDGLTAQDFNPQFYRLTTRAGYVYLLEQASASGKGGGIRKVTDPNGNVLTFSSNGITHSDGTGVTFSRDAQQRITAITDPNGAVQRYGYDLNGDLVTHTDTLGNVTTYAYAPTPGEHAHALVEIKDPLNRPLVKNLYDAQGRLYAQEDNDGNRTLFEHALAGRYSIVTDRNGNREILEYNERGDVVRRTDGENRVWQFSYDAFGNVLTETDPLNRTTTRVVNAAGDVLSVTDPLGNTTAYTYNARGQELTISDALGRIHTNEYDFTGNLLSVTDPAGNEASTVIGAKGLPQSAKDLLGKTTQYGYDGNGRKVLEVDPLGARTTWTYDANGNAKTETKQRTVNGVLVSETTAFAYDAKDRVIQTTLPDGSVTRTEYDAAGNEIAQVDALGNRTEMTYDAYGRVLTTTYPDGSTDAKAYDAEGNLVSETDRNGNTTTYAYDGNDRLVRTTYADGSYTGTEYDAAGQVIAETDARGNTTTHAYDDAGRRTHTTDALGGVTTFAYDANGNLVAQTDPNGNTTRFVYDILDRRVQVIYPDGTTTQESFDAMGHRLSVTDEVGLVTQYRYDAAGRLIEVEDAAGFVTRYGYDENGSRITLTDANGHVTRYEYDSLNRQVAEILPLGERQSWLYNAEGQMDAATDFKGQVTGYTYDDTGRTTRIDYADGQVESFVYDDNGNRTQASGADGITQFGYDELDRLIEEVRPDGSRVTYGYDQAGNRTHLTVHASGTTRTTAYTYDANNRLATVTDEEGGVTRYTYDPAGNVTAIEYPNGVRTTYVIDSRNRVRAVETHNAAGNMIAKQAYTLHVTGRRLAIEELDGTKQTFTYDVLYRLTHEATSTAANVVLHDADYGYDRAGNRVRETVGGVATLYAYDANDRLTSRGADTYTHDANGDLLEVLSTTGSKAYTWNAARRLQQATTATSVMQYLYDTEGLRTAKTVNGSTTHFLLDRTAAHAQVVGEVDPGNAANDRFYTTAGSQRIALRAANDARYFHADALGSTRALTDATGALTDQYRYEAFGKTQEHTGSSEQPFLFAGEQRDAETDEYYLRARYYDISTGRFTQRDTYAGSQQVPASQNRFTYAHGDPVFNADPSGRFLAAIAGLGVNGVRISSSAGRFSELLRVALQVSARSEGQALRRGAGHDALRIYQRIETMSRPTQARRLVANQLRASRTNMRFDPRLARMKDGREFEKYVADNVLGIPRGYKKGRITNGGPAPRGTKSGYRVPDFEDNFSLYEIKLSARAIDRDQLADFVKYAKNQNKAVHLVFRDRPSASEIKSLERLFDGIPGGKDVMFAITHIR